MTLNKQEQSFLEINKQIIEGLISKKIADYQTLSAHGRTVDIREKARLLILEFESFLGDINDLLRKETKKKSKFTGV